MKRIAFVTLLCGLLGACGSSGKGGIDAGRDSRPDVEVGSAAGADGAAGADASVDQTAADAPSDADASIDAAVDGGDAMTCVANEQKCVDATTLSVCARTGNQLTLFTCSTGCEAGACKTADLQNGWDVFQFKPADDSPQTLAKYTFEDGGLVTTETENAMPSAYVNQHVFTRLHATGKISVQTASDDDFIGFVFGWQDMTHFYFLDWKKAAQTDPTCGAAQVGVTLKRMSATAEPATCDTYWSSAGTSNVAILSPTTGAGWVTGTVYTFDLSWAPGEIHITLKDGATVVATVTSTDATYTSGRFGFWNYSQADVRYESFTIEPSP